MYIKPDGFLLQLSDQFWDTKSESREFEVVLQLTSLLSVLCNGCHQPLLIRTSNLGLKERMDYEYWT